MGWNSERRQQCGSRRRTKQERRSTAGIVSLLALAIAMGLEITAAQAAPVASRKLAPDLQRLLQAPTSLIGKTGSALSTMGVAAPAKIRVLIRTSAWLGSHASRARLQTTGATLGRTFPNVGVAAVEATPAQIAALAADPSVLSLSPDRTTASAAQLDVNPVSIGVPEAAALAAPYLGGGGLNGRGVTVAVLDSGVAPVSDLSGRVVAFQDFVSGGGGSGLPYDDYGHGTHVAGIVAGSGMSSSGPLATRTYRGIAPGASLVAAKVLDGQGRGTVSDAIAALDWCVANRTTYNIRVINLSLGAAVAESYTTDPLCQAAERAVAAGIVVVVAAGNDRLYGSISAPGNDPAVITVGAVSTHGSPARSAASVTSYTSRGPSLIDVTMKPDLVAPGNQIVSLRAPGSWIDVNHPETNVSTSEYLRSFCGLGAGPISSYARLSGTSMAAPAVSGAAALLLQVNPGLTPSGVKAALMLSAQVLSGPDPLTGRTGVYDPLTQGAGSLNLPGAVQLAAGIQSGGFVGAPALTSTIAGQSFPWSLATLPTLWLRTDGVTGGLLTGVAWSGIAAGEGWTDDLVWGGSIALAGASDQIGVMNVSWGDNSDQGGKKTGADNVSWGDNGDDDFIPTIYWRQTQSLGAVGDAPTDPGTGGDNVSWGNAGDDDERYADGDGGDVAWDPNY